ncbi:DNA mismatch repair protein msh6, partial [Rhizoclosmatium hyalinum]
MLGKNKKTPTSAAKSGQNQRTITSFFAKPNATTPARAVGPSARQSLGQPEPHPHPQQQQQQQPPSTQPPSTIQTTAQSLPPRESDKMDEDEDDNDDNDAPVLAKKRSKFVVADDDSDDDAAEVETAKKRKTNNDDDDSHDKFNSDAMKTPARKSLDKFASPRFDFVQKTPASSSSQNISGTPFSAMASTPASAPKSASKQTPLTSTDKKAARAQDFKERNQDRYAFLLDERDADKNRPGEPSYDPRTLYIPPSAWSKFTPFEHQFWEIKSKHWDTVVFFKKGKFFEVYEKDADVASKEFDWK